MCPNNLQKNKSVILEENLEQITEKDFKSMISLQITKIKYYSDTYQTTLFFKSLLQNKYLLFGSMLWKLGCNNNSIF